MDNFGIDVTCEGDVALAMTVALAFRALGIDGQETRGKRRGATHYAIRDAVPASDATVPEHSRRKAKPLRLVFHEYSTHPPYEKREDLVRLPFVLDAAGAADFARRWLAEAEYGPEPDHDGDNGKGWRVWNEGWGRVDGDVGAIVAVSPSWAMYGK